MIKEVDMTGYKKIDKMELSREMTIILLGMGTLSLFIFGYFFTLIYTLITQNTAAFNFTYGTILIAIPIFVFTLLFHESIHGIVVSIYGGKPRYGAGVAHYILPYLYTTTETKFFRNQFILILISPLIVISVIGIMLMIIFPSVAHWFLFPLTINAAGAVGDLWMVFSLLKYPEHVLLEDDPAGTIIYGENTYEIVKVSSKCFIRDFFRGFLAVFSFLIILFYLIFPIILGILNVDSLVLGVENSPFTIFKFLGGGEGYELFVGFLPLLSFSGVIGLIYSLVRSGKRIKLKWNEKEKDEASKMEQTWSKPKPVRSMEER
jgi:hypothetical protein